MMKASELAHTGAAAAAAAASPSARMGSDGAATGAGGAGGQGGIIPQARGVAWCSGPEFDERPRRRRS